MNLCGFRGDLLWARKPAIGHIPQEAMTGTCGRKIRSSLHALDDGHQAQLIDRDDRATDVATCSCRHSVSGDAEKPVTFIEIAAEQSWTTPTRVPQQQPPLTIVHPHCLKAGGFVTGLS